MRTPRYAEWRTTTVKQLWRPRAQPDDVEQPSYWIVRIHHTAAHHFEVSRGDGGREAPGWLGHVEFESYEEAATFASDLDDIVSQLADMALERMDITQAAIRMISEAHSARSR